VDVAADGVASSVVLVVTPSGAGSGVVVDAAGHVLTNWHLVRDYPAVSVLFKSAASARPALERSYVARVVKLNRSADLALLSIEDPPAALRPMPIAKGGDPRRSEVLHALGHQRSDAWSDLRGVVLQSRPDSSWFSGGSVLHRGDVIRVRVEQSAVIPGVPLLDGRMELVGLGAYVDLPKHELVAVSARTIRAFLESAEARTAAATGG